MAILQGQYGKPVYDDLGRIVGYSGYGKLKEPVNKTDQSLSSLFAGRENLLPTLGVKLPKGARDLIESTRQLQPKDPLETETLKQQRERELSEATQDEVIGQYSDSQGILDPSATLSTLFALVYGADAPLAAQSIEDNIPDPKMRETVMRDLLRAQNVVQRSQNAVDSGQMTEKEQSKIVSNVKATVKQYINPYAKTAKVINEADKLVTTNLDAIKKHQEQYKIFERNLSKQEDGIEATEKRIEEIDRKIKEVDNRPANTQDRKEFVDEMKRRMEKLAQERGLPNSKTGYALTSADSTKRLGPEDIAGTIAQDLKEVLGSGYTREVLSYALATIKHETKDAFKPVKEGFYNDEKYGYEPGFTGKSEANKRGYSGGENYYGRGYIQLTHDYNYKKYGDMLGIDLVSNPELAEDPKIASKILALYFKEHGTADLVNKGRLVEARRTINPDDKGVMVADTAKGLIKIAESAFEASNKPTPTPTSAPRKEPFVIINGKRVDTESRLKDNKEFLNSSAVKAYKNYVEPGIDKASDVVQEIFKRILGAADDVMPKAYASDIPSQQLPVSQKPQENDFFKKYISPFSSKVSNPFARIIAQTAPIKMPSPQVSVARTISQPAPRGPSTPAYATPANANASSTSGRSVYIPPPTPKSTPRQTFVSTPQKSVQQQSGPSSRASGAYPVGNTKTGRILYSDGSVH